MWWVPRASEVYQESERTMKVFIMWSGRRSRSVASSLHTLLKTVIQRPRYFISTENIERGALWGSIIAGELETTHVGIACLTTENLESTWIHYEAGAISKVTADAIVVPYLIGVDSSELTGPLTRFQATSADRPGTFALLQSINATLPSGDRTDPEALRVAFDALWPAYESVLKENVALPAVADRPARPQQDILREILDTVREFRIVMHRLGGPTPRLQFHRETREPASSTALVGRHILWVDDNPQDVSYPREELERLGATVITATSTEEAMAAIEGSVHFFDFVITDMGRGPNPLAGIDLLNNLRGLGHPAKVIVYSTSDEARKRIHTLLELGASAVITGEENLVQEVMRLCQ